MNLANKLLGVNLGDDTLILGTSGRYEFKIKVSMYIGSFESIDP